MGNLSELRVNLHKSEILIMTAEQYETQQLMQIMECRASTFPIKYLGLPLSNKKLAKEHYMDLIRKFRAKLPGWKTTLLSPGGRIALLNSSLTSMLIFYMSTFLLPKWVIKEIDKIRRNFLWHGHKDQGTGKHMNPVN
jgi:hypothetical protein